MSAATVHFEKPAAHVARLEIDAPPSNALGQGPRRAFFSHLDAIEGDDAIRAVVITGRGKSFCSGDDLKEREAARSGGEDAALSFAALIDRIENLRVPVIAAVNGWAVGGGLELTLCCDIRIAAEDAQFVCAAVNVGLIASAYRLPRLIGVGPAKHMLLTGSPFDAATVERFGLVTEVVPSDKLREASLLLADRIATRAPLSVEATKRVAGKAIDLDRDEAARALGREFQSLVKSADHAEALAAFREKRPPQFRRN
ncbi:MAG TPA: enoyl-CoA hydratase/isomerase family protein [Rhizomicrobium sp.]|nr:enoyl-CoA hydratase/isomerase family protein [Rhizomicrobium sp.]